MLAWDSYCALCAAPFYDVVQLKGNHFISSYFRRDSGKWLKDMRILGINPQAIGGNKIRCFISGPAEGWEALGTVYASAGDDPNFPVHRHSDSLNVDTGADEWSFPMYESLADPPVFPFHSSCHEIFLQAFGNDVLNKDTLYATMVSVNKGCERTLSINYYELERHKGAQWFRCIPGTEAFIMDPCDISDVVYYLENAPRHIPVAPLTLLAPRSHDIFSKLPTELILHIMNFLPPECITSLKVSSRTSAQVAIPNSHWRRRLYTDMPWLPNFILEDSVDFRRVYARLDAASKNKGIMLRGLANRRRIWDICSRLVDLYRQKSSGS